MTTDSRRFSGWGPERRTPEGRRSRREVLSRRRPAAWPTLAASLGAFLAAMAFLAGQMRDGNDPALGRAKPAAAKPRAVVVRRIVKRTVVHHPRRSGAQPSALPSPSEASAEQNAPAPAPAPAPQPAPLTTRSS
jgi:hypothetical protein